MNADAENEPVTECKEIPRRNIALESREEYQSDEVAGSFEGVDSGRVGYVDDGHVVHFEDDVVDLEPAIDGGRATADDLGDANGRIVANVRIVRAARDAESQAGIAAFQHHLLVVPRFVAIGLQPIPKHQDASNSTAANVEFIRASRAYEHLCNRSFSSPTIISGIWNQLQLPSQNPSISIRKIGFS